MRHIEGQMDPEIGKDDTKTKIDQGKGFEQVGPQQAPNKESNVGDNVLALDFIH